MWNFTNSGEKAAVLPVICSIVLMAAAQMLSHVLLNSFFAASMGIIFGAVFTLSGNIWPDLENTGHDRKGS